MSDREARSEIQVAVTECLKSDPRIDGVICTSAHSAIAAAIGAETFGHRIGEDLDIVAKEELPFLTHFRPKIRSVGEDVSKAGAFLAEAAIHSIEAPDQPPLQLLASEPVKGAWATG